VENLDLVNIKSLMDQIGVCVFVFDPKSFLFTYVNKGAVEQLGCTREELLNMRPIDIKPEYDENSFRQLVAPLLSGESCGLCFKTLHRHKSGADIPVYVLLQLMTPENGRQRFVAIVRDVPESRRIERALRESSRLLGEYATSIEAIRNEEREHIARELHDELGQHLVVLRNEVAMLGIKYGSGNPSLMESVVSAKANIDRTMAKVRNIPGTLRPDVLDQGLVPSVEWLLESYCRASDINSRLDIVCEQDIVLSAELTTAIFRVLQGSLTNILRHANAGNVEIILFLHKNEINITVQDDGQGFSPEEIDVNKAFGLVAMRERLNRFGGDVLINTSPGNGVRLNIWVPLLEGRQ
jgi:PAS domain S-box-containing protein